MRTVFGGGIACDLGFVSASVGTGSEGLRVGEISND